MTLVIAVVTLASLAMSWPSPSGASTSHATEAMPNFIGMGRSSVYAEMYSAQLYFKTRGPGANTSAWVRVVGEIPAAGTTIPVLSTVILEVTEVPLVTHTPVVKKPVVKKPVVKKPVAKKPSVKKTGTKTTKGKNTGKGVTVLSTSTPPKKTTHKPTKTKGHSTVDSRVGVATWYSYIPGQCASHTLPFGTHLTVEDLQNGKSIMCVVTDREGAGGTRVVDLSETQFAELAPLSTGVIPVRVTW